MTWFDYDGDGGTTIRFGDGTFGDVPAARHGLQRALPGGRRLGRERPRGHDRERRAGAGAGIDDQCLHQPVPGRRRRGRRDHRAGARPRTADIQRRAAPRRAGRRLRGGGAVAALGAAGGHHVPLDGQLAHRADQRRSRRDASSRRSLSSSRSPSCSTRSGWPATRATSCRRATSRSTCRSRSARQPTSFGERRGGRRARRVCSPATLPGGAAGLLRPLPAGASASRWSPARCSPRSSRAPASTACPDPVPRSAASDGLGAAARAR